MHRIDTDTALPGGIFTEGDPTVPTPATVVSADWLNAVQAEIAGVIEGAGIELARVNNAQLLTAITSLIAIKLPGLATLERPGLVQPDGETCYLDGARLKVFLAEAGQAGLVLPDWNQFAIVGGHLTAKLYDGHEGTTKKIPPTADALRLSRQFAKFSTRTTTGVWTLTECVPGEALIITIEAAATGLFYGARMYVTSGAATTPRFWLGDNGSNSTGSSTCQIIATDATVTITIDEIAGSPTLSAWR